MPGTAVPVVWSCRPHDKEPSDVTEENKDISRRWREELDRKNWSALDEFVAPDVVMHSAGNPAPMDRDAMKPMLLTFYSASPGMHHTFEDQIAEGDKVTFRMTFRGTHQGECQGIPPTGKEIAVEAIVVDRMAAGRWWNTGPTWTSSASCSNLASSRLQSRLEPDVP